MKKSAVCLVLISSLLLIAGCGDGQSKPATEGGDASVANSLVPNGCEAALARNRYASFYEGAECLFKGKGAVQTGVKNGAIKPEQVVVLRGRVVDSSGQGIEGVEVTVAGSPEVGLTRTRAGGHFDKAANGGGLVTIKLVKEGTFARRVSGPPNGAASKSLKNLC